MKILITFLLTAIFMTANISNAALFGASTYEECMSDGKVGRTNNELDLLAAKCQKQFPALPKLYAMKNSKVLCTTNEGASKTYKFINNTVTTESGKTYQVSVKTPELVVVKAKWIEQLPTKKNIPTIFKLNPLYGSATLEALETGLVSPPAFFLNCIEQ